MFGSTAFNRGAFNRSTGSEDFVWVGSAAAAAASDAILTITNHAGGRADAIASATAAINAEYSVAGVAAGEAGTDADQIRRRYMSAQADAIGTASAGGLYLLGTETLRLEGITLQAGDDVEIDTERMTLLINGANGIPYLTDDSTFFMLSKGDVLSILGTGTATVKLLWKDRWLG